MQNVYLSDITMMLADSSAGFSLSFREKIELAKLLDRAGLRALEAVPLGAGIFYGIAFDFSGSAAVVIQRAHAHTGGNALALNGDHRAKSSL